MSYEKKSIPHGVSAVIPLAVRLLVRQEQLLGKRELNIKVGRDGMSVSAFFMPEEKKLSSSSLSERRGEHG